MTRLVVSLAVFVLLSCSLSGQETGAETHFVRWMDRIAQEQLDARAKRIDAVRSMEDAERRKAEVRAKVLASIGGLPSYLHAAVIPGFCLKWDLDDLRKAVAPRSVFWTDPTDWTDNALPIAGDFRYRGFEEGDELVVKEWMR